jgi:hypothetical protein
MVMVKSAVSCGFMKAKPHPGRGRKREGTPSLSTAGGWSPPVPGVQVME